MPRQIYIHDHPDRCVIGTVGEPGQRTFYLQARSGGRMNSVVLEKEQARLLAERIDALLDEMTERGRIDRADVALAGSLVDDEPLEDPIGRDFRVGALGLGWNAESSSLVVEAFAVGDEDEDLPELESDSAEGPDTLRLRMSAAAAREFARRALVAVSAGRPVCPFCQLPLEPEGHICPRANGFRR